MPAADLGKPNKNGRVYSSGCAGESDVSVVFGETLPSGLLAPHGNNRFMGLRSGAGRSIVSAVVPAVKVDDPVVQGMVDEVSKVLRGVDDRYFQRIQFVAWERKEELTVLFFAAEGKSKGKGFRVGVICGVGGVVEVMFMTNSGRLRSRWLPVSSADDLRQQVDHVGKGFAEGRRK